MPKLEPPVRPPLGERIPAPDHGVTLRFQEATDLTLDEERALLRLLTVAYNGGPTWFRRTADPLDHLRWKFRDFPGTAQVELIEDGDRIVGTVFGMRRRFLVRDHELIGRNGVDLALDPSIQGRGIHALRLVDMFPLRKQMLSNVAFDWPLSTHPVALHLRARQGIIPFANYLETHLKPLSLHKLLRRSKRSDQAVGASSTRARLESRKHRLQRLGSNTRLAIRLAAASARAAIRRHPREPLELKTLARFDDRVDEFWQQASASFDFIQIRSADYLNWRFCDPRGGEFVVRAVEDGGHLLGYAATRIDESEAVLADLLTLPGRPDVVRALVADAIDLARARGAPLLRAWLPRTHPYRDALREFGFASSPAVASLEYQIWWGDADEMAFLDNPSARVHVMIADSDHT